jgi:hypothetical protein
MKYPFGKFSVFFFLAVVAIGCSKEEEEVVDPITDPNPTPTSPFHELFAQGIDRYMGVFTPTSTVEAGMGVTQYFFDIPDGPICYTGNAFSMYTRDGAGDDLLIFLQGGGFCSPTSRAAVEMPIPLVPFGIMNPNDAENPAASFDLGYVPYCDGSAMIGDIDRDSNGDGANDRFFRGLHNLSASLDVIHQNYPVPQRIVLAGNSAGGFAVHHALPLVRMLYPNTLIYVINDSGTGIIEPMGWSSLVEYWNGGSFYPAGCTDCIGTDGNLTGYHLYQLEQDPNIRMAYISSKQDETFAAMKQGGGEAFEAQLLEAASELNAAHPERFNSLIADGDEHTFILSQFNYTIAQTTVKQWVALMIEQEENWDSVSD